MMTAGSCIPATAIILATVVSIYGQRITTIQLDGVQYFISRMNPYSPELNYFLAYQYCRSIGLQLASFESREKADSITQYLLNAGYNSHDYWTSGNRLGTEMLIWMSSGVTFNATFDYMRKAPLTGDLDSGSTNSPGSDESTETIPSPTTKSRVLMSGSRRKSRNGPMQTGCVALKTPSLDWDIDDCENEKDFICEQTRCYYYNYGSIPVSTSQGINKVNKPVQTTTELTDSTTQISMLANNNDTPLGPLLNFTVNRRITLRPAAGVVQVSPQSSTPSSADQPLEEKPAARAIPDKETDNNVVYVMAIGASSDQQAIAYVNKHDGYDADKKTNDAAAIKKLNENANTGSMYDDDDVSTMTDVTTSEIASY